MDQVAIIKQMIQSLSSEQQTELITFLTDNNAKDNPNSLHTSNFKSIVINNNPGLLPDRPACPHCQSTNIKKNGHKDGRQRYLCKECHRTFAITNNTLLYRTQKSVETWEKFFECLLNKFSVRKTAIICDIHRDTAFIWRHKILDTLQIMQSQVKLNGVTEADETFFRVSYKGDHNKSSFKMPRKSHKRGKSVSVRGLSQEQVCVPCGVNLDGLSIGKISNLGKPSVHNLSSVFDNRIEKGSILVTDSLRSYQKLAYDNELTHVRIAKGRHTNGSFNIQKINSYHSELKRMVHGNFKGVSTKYLNNYVAYHNFANFAKGEFEDKMTILKEFIYTTNSVIECRDIPKRAAIPVLGIAA